VIKKNYENVPLKQAILHDGTPIKDTFVRWLVDKNDGAQNYAMRRFEIKPGASVSLHNHFEDHEIYILSGKGKFYNNSGQEEKVGEGDILYIPPNENHGIENLGKRDLIFICIIPYLNE